MYRHPHELERALVKRTVSPMHWDTCPCCRDRGMRMVSRETWCSPPLCSPPETIRRWESYSELEIPPERLHWHDHHRKGCCDRTCSCCILQSSRGRRVSFVSKSSVGDKYSLMERWFHRFDSDDDGFLTPENLQSLFRDIGGTAVPLSKCIRILDDVDSDGDGLLSFRDFLQLWHRAAYHEHELMSATHCGELLDIAREYDLYPDVPCSRCDGRRPRWVNNDRRGTEDTINCNCGYEKNIKPFVKLFDEEKSEKEDVRISGKADEGKIPILSSNCNTFG